MRTVLIANRGEIAVRIARAARELGLSTVAVYSEADEAAHHVRVADRAVCIGKAAAQFSYLNPEALLAAIAESGADAVHPGYGFLSENADFAAAVQAAGITWIGPDAAAIRQMGDKVAARQSARAAGVPTVPGSAGEVTDLAQAHRVAEEIGYPLAIKAGAGGGGRGIRVVAEAAELEGAIQSAQAEARAAFGSPAVYIERFVPTARHIEVQVFGDGRRAVHLGVRDCSMQRRRQKVVEEAGQTALPGDVLTAMTAASVELTEAVKYRGAGTVEYLFDVERGEFYFIEMNTRIQVEHPVTEMVYGRDLVAEQLRVAGGADLAWSQAELIPRGHSIEVRINAEDAAANFMPSPGTLTRFDAPAGPFVRVDSGFTTGSVISPYYDSMIGKIIVWGEDRPGAIARLQRALSELSIEGINTTAPFVTDLIGTAEFAAGDFHTTWLEGWLESWTSDHKKEQA